MCYEIKYRLTIAISKGNIQCVRDLVNTYGLSYSRGWSEGYVLLVLAIRHRRTEIAKLLLTYGCKVNSKNTESSNTPLRLAITNGYVEIVEMLLHRGADIQFTDTYGSTVLHNAVQQGNTKIIELLLNRGANVCAVDNNGKNPLHLAVITHRDSVVKLLLERGAKVDAQDKDGNTILHLAVEREYSTIVEDVLKYRPDINNQSNRSSLKTAVYGSTEPNKKIVENLLQYGFLVYPEDVDEPKFLHNAVAKGYSKIVEDLLKYGADVNKSDNTKFKGDGSLLHVAAWNKRMEVAKLLVNYGANVNAKNESGETPLLYAVEKSDAEITRLLLINGANIKDSPELLSTAIENECIEVVDDLLKHGADVNVVSKHRTPLEHAMIVREYVPRRFSEIVELLKKHIAMLQVAGFHVIERNLQLLINDRDFNHFKHLCKEELQIVKCEKISNSHVSFYDILTKNIHQLAIYAKNENIVQAFKSHDYRKFPIYANIIERKFKKGLVRKELMELGNQFIHSFFENLPRLPLLCIEKILSYLSNYDLKLIIQKF